MADRASDAAFDLEAALARIPEGWSRVRVGGRAYGLTKATHTAGRSVSIYAEELGGRDVVSANVRRLEAGTELRPCEMAAEKVAAFLQAWERD